MSAGGKRCSTARGAPAKPPAPQPSRRGGRGSPTPAPSRWDPQALRGRGPRPLPAAASPLSRAGPEPLLQSAVSPCGTGSSRAASPGRSSTFPAADHFPAPTGLQPPHPARARELGARAGRRGGTQRVPCPRPQEPPPRVPPQRSSGPRRAAGAGHCRRSAASQRRWESRNGPSPAAGRCRLGSPRGPAPQRRDRMALAWSSPPRPGQELPQPLAPCCLPPRQSHGDTNQVRPRCFTDASPWRALRWDTGEEGLITRVTRRRGFGPSVPETCRNHQRGQTHLSGSLLAKNSVSLGLFWVFFNANLKKGRQFMLCSDKQNFAPC